jgi:hypothetical protein
VRVGIIAAAGAEAGAEPLVGERDAHLMRTRLAIEDLGFEVVIADPGVDLAEQLDQLLAERDGAVEDVLLYASCLLAMVDGGECYICLNPAEPDVGDALGDVARAIAGRARRSTLIIAELRYDDAGADVKALNQVLGSVRGAIDSDTTGIELIAAVRPHGAHAERVPSRLTAALLEAIDESTGVLSAKQAYASAVQRGQFGAWPNALAYAGGRVPLFLREPPEPQAPVVAIAPAPLSAPQPEPEPQPEPQPERDAVACR